MAGPILNEAQLEAVTADDGPALVLAGAGSGKTRVIVERLVWLIEERGVDPRSLLALTFTNRAAGEMKLRVAERLGVDRLASWVGTFHSFGLYVLRREMDRLGRPKQFTVFDDSDQLSLMRRLVRDLPEAYGKVTPRKALSWMSRLKQDLEEPDFSAPSPFGEEEALRELWKRYHDTLLRVSAADFDDLLCLLVRLFEEHADVREKYGRRYQYVMVDEYQDTNRAQYLIARHLSKDHGNLFVVGDEDQSIYSWRGAHIRNILDFERDFPGARTFRLEQNYRSTAPILAAANAVVANNEARLGKTLRTDQTKGDPVRFCLGKDAADEARWVIEDLKEGAFAPKDTAILYRTNGQARILEEELRRKSVPYVVVGGVRFYSRKEIKDVLCYLRLLVNAADDESLRRIINVPARGIGATTMARFEEYGAARGIPLFEVLREVEHDDSLTPRARKAATSFVHLIDDLAVEARTASVEELTVVLLEKTRYREFLKESDEKDFRTRLEVVEEFLAACRQFDQEKRGRVIDFLQELALVSGVDEWESNEDALTLMTCHSAKGLEFDSIYLIGLEEGLLPHGTALDSDTQLEEERRLCYVAMTRARKKLTLTAAAKRTVHGDGAYNDRRTVSRFVGEIPRDRLVSVRGRQRAPTRSAPAAQRVEAGALKMGARVRHAKFGRGLVLYTTGSGKNLRARIRFEAGRVGTFLVDKTPLENLE